MKTRVFLACLVCLAILALPVLAEPQGVDLVLMRRHYVTNGDWSTEHQRMAGQEIMGCLVGHGGASDSTMVYELNGKFDMLESLVGYLDSAPDNRSAVFEVWADGVLVQKIGPLSSGQPPELMRAPLKGRKMLTLRIVPERYDSTHGAAWGNPKLWANLGDQLPGGLLMNVDGHSMQTVSSKVEGREQVSVPLPLQPGVHEYRVRMEYNPSLGKVQVQTSEGPASGE